MSPELRQYLVDLEYDPHAPPPTTDQVKRRWKDLCHKHHPDKGGHPDDFQRIMHAYQMLTDPEYRHAYKVEEARKKKHNAFCDLNIRLQVPVAFEIAFFGQKVSISYNRLEFTNDLELVKNEKLDVVAEVIKLPAGSCDGYEHMLPNGGHKQGDVIGQAVVLFAPMPHPKFKVVGQDVCSTEPIPLDTLLMGGKVEVPTMYGLKALKVPPGTKPGTKLRIKKCGVDKRGDHLVQVDAVFPSQEDLRTSEAWKGLGIDWKEEAEEVDPEEIKAELLKHLHKSLGYDFILQSQRKP